MTEKLHIVAEAGTTHEGNPETALRLVQVAKEAGADLVKFQLIDPPALYLPQIRSNGVLEPNPAIAARQKQVISRADWSRVAARAKQLDIAFSASIFDPGTLAFLLELDPPYIKIASTDANNLKLIEHVAASGKPILISTGFSDLGEIERMVETLTKSGAREVVLLHCVSVYPCETRLANVRFVEVLKTAFGLPVGFSDHTENSVAAIAAVALGATWLEKHFTLDRTASGFDHAYAMEPEMLRSYIDDVRSAHGALERRSPKVGASEAAVGQRARRGLWSASDLQAGHEVGEEDVLVVRPPGPLTPAHLPDVIGRRLSRPVHASQAFRWEDFE